MRFQVLPSFLMKSSLASISSMAPLVSDRTSYALLLLLLLFSSSISSLPPQFRLRSFNRSSPSPSFARFIRPQSSPFTRASLPLPLSGSLGFNPLHTLPDAKNSFSSASKNSHLRPLPPAFKAYSAASSDGVPSDIPSASDQSLAATEKNDTGGTLLLGCFFGLWYLFNIYFNIYNKQVCLWRPLPFLCN